MTLFTVSNLRPEEVITVRCDPCQIVRRLSRAELLLLLGDADLHNLGLREELRCPQCWKPFSSAWPSWQCG